ncbi:MAG: phosphoglucosamine mutase [Alphaproteobacteria bacterium]|nr:MAG: phosphoglucosamine mutase [Alphaproteobacteria bacterium]
MSQNQPYFRTDGIRGRANQFPMTAEISMKIAMATACVLKEQKKESESTNRVVIGKDTRLSGYMFEHAITAGFLSIGLDVIQVGPIPTPGIAMLTRSMRADLGVMITASHNKFQDNGFKFFDANSFKLDDGFQKRIETLIESNFEDKLVLPEQCGKAKRLDDALGRYVEHVKSSFPKSQSLAGMKIVLDCANGAAYKVAPQILWEMEAELITIGDDPNGRNINEGCGATNTRALQCRVIQEGADIGIALDGDADRLIIVDEKGQVVDGDQLMAILAVTMKKQGKLAKNTLVATVMSNMGMERFLEKENIHTVRTAVGDRALIEEMRENKLSLGGEQSGHIIVSEYSTTGDGLLAALQILSILKNSNKRASEVLNVFMPYPQLLKNIYYVTEDPLSKDEIQNAITLAQNNLADNGRVIVRPSGTEPVIRVMAEGQDKNLIDNIVNTLCHTIEKVTQA